MGHKTGIRVFVLEPEYLYNREEQTRFETGFLKGELLFEFTFQYRHVQAQLNGRRIDKFERELPFIYRQLPPNIKGVSGCNDHGSLWDWGWCYPFELKKLNMDGNLDEWVCGLLRVAATFDNNHLIEIYDAG